MNNVISIKKKMMSRDPETLVNEILNDPARLARLKEKREKAKEQAKREAEEQARRQAENEKFQTFTLKLALGYSFLITVVAVAVALLM